MFPSRAATTSLVAGIVIVAALGARAAAGGIDPESNTDGFNPAADLYDIAETQRQGQVALQQAAVDWIARSILYGAGDLWGPPIGWPPIRQPIGHESKQVGPNRWIYRPLYAEDVPLGNVNGVAGATQPAPRQPAAELPAPSDAKPGDFVPPQGPPRKPITRRPREF
jgi:hypothetical protein